MQVLHAQYATNLLSCYLLKYRPSLLFERNFEIEVEPESWTVFEEVKLKTYCKLENEKEHEEFRELDKKLEPGILAHLDDQICS